MTPGERIKKERKIAGITQEELGKRVGVSGSSIAQWENNLRNPKVETLKRIASALGISADYLLSGTLVSETHLGNGIHIYKNNIPFKNIEPYLRDFGDDGLDKIIYQDEYLIVTMDKNSSATNGKLNELLDVLVPFIETHCDTIEELDKKRINTALEKLNDVGRQKAIERVEELTEITKYQRKPEEDEQGAVDSEQDKK